MSDRVEGTFETTSWDEQECERLAGEAKVTRATFTQAFAGGIEADTVSDTVMAYRQDGTADFVGLLRVSGRLGDRMGTFVLQNAGTFDGQQVQAATAVVPGTGTGELAGLSGSGTFAAPMGTTGTYTLEYTVG